MTVESLKSELQQVLDNDLILRKEFNELKRSLSDYRNQLIMRDEDCKRLQVTIDVLNTKLVVMERDNNNYKAELTSFKELRSTIKDQLQSKQDEIEERLKEIENLKNDLNALASGYEQRIEEVKLEGQLELSRVKEDFNTQLGEMNAVAAYKEQAIKEEYENRITDITASIANKEQSFEINFHEELADIKNKYEEEIQSLKNQHAVKIDTLTSGSQEEIDSLITNHQLSLSELQNRFNGEREQFESQYAYEINHLRNAIEEQRQTLTNNFNHQIENLKTEHSLSEEKLIANYELKLSELTNQLSLSNTDITENFQKQILELTNSHEQIINETKIENENKISGLIHDYEEKLSVTLIHSNSQNSKLNDELEKVRLENENAGQQIQEMTSLLELKSNEMLLFGNKITDLENQLIIESTKFDNLNVEFDEFKSKALLSNTEKVNELLSHIELLTQNHNSEIQQLNRQIEEQVTEIGNLGLILEATTNQLSTSEISSEENAQALDLAQEKLNKLEFDLESSKLAFEKLLNENTNLINEIEEVQQISENREAELNLMNIELEEVKAVSMAKAEDYKEILSVKNFEITNLEASKAALSEELVHTKMEVLNLENQIQNNVQSQELVEELSAQVSLLQSEKDSFMAELGLLNDNVKDLNSHITGLNAKALAYELEIDQLKSKSTSEEQDAFIDRLFLQIDGLNNERLVLLEEKEQMANQLLKMNDVISNISQHVDSEKINVTDLNNHRKNIILATNSNDHKERSEMKEQINDLVREIDKCIALLSA
jgi:chromosome segregation ATPase